MATLPNFPAIRPSLLLDFASSGRADPRVALSRASTDIAAGPNGVMQVLPLNTPAIGYDMDSGKALGIFVGKSRTNRLTWSERMWDTAQWVVGSTLAGGSFASAVESLEVLDIYGKADPVTKITVLSPAGLFCRKVVPLPAGALAISVFVYVPVQAGVNNYQVGSDLEDIEVSYAPASSLFGRWVRVHMALNAAVTRGVLDLNMRVNGAWAPAGFVFYIMGAQASFSQGNPPYIKTTGAQATRAADQVALGGAAFAAAFNPDEWTLVFSSEKSPLALTEWPRYISINSGSAADEFMVVDQAAAGISVGAQAAGVFQGEVGIPVLGGFTLALSYKDKQMRISLNGGSVVTRSMASAPVVNQMSIGGNAWGGKIEAAIARLSLYPKQLTDLQLQVLSA